MAPPWRYGVAEFMPAAIQFSAQQIFHGGEMVATIVVAPCRTTIEMADVLGISLNFEGYFDSLGNHKCNNSPPSASFLQKTASSSLTVPKLFYLSPSLLWAAGHQVPAQLPPSPSSLSSILSCSLFSSVELEPNSLLAAAACHRFPLSL
ncbi:hypothetical protein S245_024739, partial [Arachis hypogaea]